MNTKYFYAVGAIITGVGLITALIVWSHHDMVNRGWVGMVIPLLCGGTIIVAAVREGKISTSQTELASDFLKGVFWPVWWIIKFFIDFSKLGK